MVTGHFATALVPYALQGRSRPAPFWLFLLACQFLDFLMLGLAAAGVESLLPAQLLQLSFAGMRADMHASHDLLPVAGWALGFAALAWAATRNGPAALWCAALVVGHELCDLVVGFKHGVHGELPTLGWNLYTQAPVAGLLAEAALCVGITWWFTARRRQEGRPLSRTTVVALHGVLAGTALASLPVAHRPLSHWIALLA
ncbi:MAG: hypothetical protein EPO01_07125 [Aquabacterium sp.]|jgi:hypothetical protein|nr:MAG: hypothetical protein EPO12_20920 [Aquabacterium sp.]TAL23461.1 MAG: hypothetical protein EPO01_07125 [Aquabacterium sp.]